MSGPILTVEVDGSVATLVMNRPGKRNAMSDTLLTAIATINDISQSGGLFAESLAASLSQTTSNASEGLLTFLEKRAPKFR